MLPIFKYRMSSNNPSQSKVDKYVCPFCDFTDKSEYVVRCHITSTRDSWHKGRNAFIDPITINGVDKSGDLVEKVDTDFSNSGDISGKITTKFFPNDLTDKQKKILTVTLHNPSLSVKDIQSEIKKRYDVDVSASYIDKVTKDKLGTVKSEDENKSSTKYEDLTDIQKSIIDYAVTQDNPLEPNTWENTQTTVAEKAGCHSTNIRSTLKNYESFIQHRKAKLDARDEINGKSKRNKETETKEMKVKQKEVEEGETEDTIEIKKDKMKSFAQSIDTQLNSANSQYEDAPRGSMMKVHASGKIEILEKVEEFLTEVASENM